MSLHVQVAETMIAADTLSQESGMLLGVPNPHPADPKVINEAVSTSLAEASCRNIHGMSEFQRACLPVVFYHCIYSLHTFVPRKGYYTVYTQTSQ